MIGWICFALIGIGTVYGVMHGTLGQITEELLSVPESVMALLLKTGGVLCLFCGIMRVAEAGGLVGGFSRILSRPLGVLMPRTKTDPELLACSAMNLASNFFGLGNAATPYGLRACGRMNDGTVSLSLAVFLILNTCSVQLLPTTIFALRVAEGAENPTDILPAVWIVQVVTCAVGVILVRLMVREGKKV